ncbi:MAG: branched-chain amino acid ABC transporter permease, partial [Actinobacteria bacterium]|nr:branched-chain amino acid ABC transporter permease [Actinomycetota bacterium]
MKISLKRKSEKKSKKGSKSFDQAKWIRGFTIAAVSIWVFYAFIVDLLPYEVASFFQKWMPASTVNESLVWVICALGLNIVVGYAGLLDLGFVAFWAIGGYSAGWFMSDFFHQVNI